MEDVRLGPYQLVAELGSGGMGKVYRAEVRGPVPGLEAGRPVALKVLHAHLLESPGFFKRFLREADIGRTIEHENVVRTYDCDALLHDGVQQNFLVMEYMEGQTLRDLLQELGRVPEELCRHIGCEVAKGLAAIHEAGVVHRDLKPENVLITRDHVVKVMDLGVARLQDEAIRLSRAGAFVGSLEYAAPEQFRRADTEPDGRADLHALGVVLYELATGLHPFRDEDVSKVLRRILDEEPRRVGDVNPQLSPFFEEVVHTLIAKDREERFRAASDLAEALDESEDGIWWKDRATALRLETKRPLRRIRIPRETALYGRDDELAKLHALYDRAKAGDGQVLLLEGEAGIGKTRLVDEFVGRLRQEGEDLNFLFGSYPPGGAATAAGAFSTAYREHFGQEGLSDALRPYLATTPLLVPAFAALLKGDATPEDASPLGSDALQTVFIHATRGLAAERPTVVLVDDLHFAPDEGRALFSALAAAVPGHRILLIGSMRPGSSESWAAQVARLDHADTASLVRLGAKDLARLLEDAFHSERLARELGHQIALKSDGNPFFAFEIIRGLREGQLIARQPDGTWVTTRVIEDIKVPSSVLDLVHARVADLEEADRDLIDVASCCGFSFDPSLVAEALGLTPIAALKRFGRIERAHRLVRSAGRRYVFDHHQVQEALYDGLHEQLREQYHAAVGQALRERVGEDPEGAEAVELCEHFLAGGSGMDALPFVDAATNHLDGGHLHGRAIQLIRRVLDVPDLVTGGKRARLRLRECRAVQQIGRNHEARALIEEVLAFAEETGDQEVRLSALVALGNHCNAIAEYDEGIAHLRMALVEARATQATDTEASASTSLGLILHELSRDDEARACHERALFLAQEHGYGVIEAGATVNLGLVHFAAGHFDEARSHFEGGRTLARKVGQRPFESAATGNLANALFKLGRYADAREGYESQRRLCREIGYRNGEGIALLNRGSTDTWLGRWDRAQEALEEALRLARETGGRRPEGFVLLHLGKLHEERAEVAQARRYYGEAASLWRELGYVSGLAGVLADLGRFEADQGDEARGIACLDEAGSIARDIGDPSSTVLAAVYRARLPGGDLAAARGALEAHAPRVGREVAMMGHFGLWRLTGDVAHLAQAKDHLDYLRAHAPEDCRETMVENVLVHRAIARAEPGRSPLDA